MPIKRDRFITSCYNFQPTISKNHLKVAKIQNVIHTKIRRHAEKILILRNFNP